MNSEYHLNCLEPCNNSSLRNNINECTIPIKSLKSTTYLDESILVLYKPMNTKNKIRTENKCYLIMIHL